MPARKTNPPHVELPPIPGSYRSILKWGAPDITKRPSRHWLAMLRKAVHLSDTDLSELRCTGEEKIQQLPGGALSTEQLSNLAQIVGGENVLTDDYNRARYAYGKTMIDLLRMREGIIANPPDAVVRPRSTEDIRNLMRWCSQNHVPLTPFGAGSSVTRGVEPTCGGLTLDVSAHLNRVIDLNTIDQTVTVEPGILGPNLEARLNNAPAHFGSPHSYTCGHFPQSFEYSSVGGWVVTRGAGQNSTYYGKIEDLVVSQQYITPAGDLASLNVPAQAMGPDIDQIMIGSEGTLGVLVATTLRVFRYTPESRRRFSYFFHNWHEALAACREVMQEECGHPSAFRLSDPEETDIAMELYGIAGTPIDLMLRAAGYRPGKRCLLIGTADGHPKYTELVAKGVSRVCRHYSAIPTSGLVTRRWEANRFTDPYLRDELQDLGILTDTLECAVNWSNLEQTWAAVREVCHKRPDTICMTHLSHFYPHGANLYFIFIGRIETANEYLAYQASIIDAISASGAALSHHHGIGKMIAPWLPTAIGPVQMGLMRAIKAYLDPEGLMNPGGTLALDLPEASERPRPG